MRDRWIGLCVIVWSNVLIHSPLLLRIYGNGSAVIAEPYKERKGNLCSAGELDRKQKKINSIAFCSRSLRNGKLGKQTSPFFLPFLHVLWLPCSTAPTSSQLGIILKACEGPMLRAANKNGLKPCWGKMLE